MFSTKKAKVRNLYIGGSYPVRVQTMYNSALKADETDSVVELIGKLAQMGCDLIRFSYTSEEDGSAFKEIASRSVIPVVADIHFDYLLAIDAIKNKADKIRINPGNIGAKWKRDEVVRAALDSGVAIRIGLNSGSLPANNKGLKRNDLMVETALSYINDFESLGFTNTVVSLKSSSTEETLEANRKLNSLCDYPIHLGVTEAGSSVISSVRSTWALGNLLNEKIGDTIRVSITGSVSDEVISACEILRTLGLKKTGVRLISCPRCGRHTFDTERMVKSLEEKLLMLDKDITVAIMGCQVNGPGEAKEADFALTGIGRKAFLYKKGELYKEVDYSNAEKELLDAIQE